MPLDLEVDHRRRTGIRANHSATHLLHEGLRAVLGAHVAQKGSMVAPDRLRFDFSHPKPMDPREVGEVERLANRIIQQNAAVGTRLMAVDDAIASGAMALFGEKYGDEVRVVSMGTAEEGEKAGKAYSIELCGGTHVRATGDIGLVHVIGESAVGAGVRRLEALTGESARAYLNEQDARVRRMAAALKVAPAEAADRVEALVEERRRLERELAEVKKRLALAGDGGSSDRAASSRQVAGVAFVGRVLDGVSGKDLKGLVDEAKAQLGSGVVAFVGTADGKASVVVGVTPDLTSRFDAVALVREASTAIGGKGGGGRPDMAQAGGPETAKAEAAVAAVEAALQAAG
jgi:alanyl-tRNA synthetase